MSFDEIFTSHFKSKYKQYVSISTKRLSNNPSVAEEAVQEAYARAWKYRRRYDKEKEFDSWFRTIFNNVVKEVSNKERLYGAIDEDVKDSAPIYKDNNSLYKLIKKYNCSERDRDVIVLRYIKGMSIKSIPCFVDISYGNARKVCNLFKKSIEDLLLSEGFV